MPQGAPIAVESGSHGSNLMTSGKDCGLCSRNDGAAPGQPDRQQHRHRPQLASLGSRRSLGGGGGTGTQPTAAPGNVPTKRSYGEVIEGASPARHSSSRNGATAAAVAAPASTDSQCPFCQAVLPAAEREDHIAAELAAVEDGPWHDFRPGLELEAGADVPR